MDDSILYRVVAGIDEVGRGSLAGSVIAAAVILDPDKPITGLVDSKKLTNKKRRQLAKLIQKNARSWAVGRAEVSEIDQINILQASLLAMTRAFHSLTIKPDWVQVDGNYYPSGICCQGEGIIQGDRTIAEISAASIVAKVARDDEMILLDQLYPGYRFSQHKGYPTRLHLTFLKQFGASDQHRRSFSPVKKIIETER